jgi:hypothetical protein
MLLMWADLVVVLVAPVRVHDRVVLELPVKAMPVEIIPVVARDMVIQVEVGVLAEQVEIVQERRVAAVLER